MKALSQVELGGRMQTSELSPKSVLSLESTNLFTSWDVYHKVSSNRPKLHTWTLLSVWLHVYLMFILHVYICPSGT